MKFAALLHDAIANPTGRVRVHCPFTDFHCCSLFCSTVFQVRVSPFTSQTMIQMAKPKVGGFGVGVKESPVTGIPFSLK